jgi:hypothetical protein
MAKDIHIVIPRRFLQELINDRELGSSIYNAALQAENSKEGETVEFGKRGKATVYAGTIE